MKTLLILFLCVPSFLFGQSALNKAVALFEAKKYGEAKNLLETVAEKNSDYAAARFYLGRIAFDEKKYDDAQDYFEEAIEANDNVADYHNWLGNTYGTIARDANMIKQGMLAPKMKKAWEKAIALDPKNLDARESLIMYYTKAPGFMGGSIDKAKEVAKQIMKLKPAEGHRQMGNIWLTEKKPAEAEKEFLEMVKADPTYTAGLGNFYVIQKQYDKAFALFDEVLKKNPEDYLAVYQLGKVAALSGQRLDHGEECLKKYLSYSPKQNEPTHAGAYMRLAQIKEKRGNKAEAKKLFDIALKLDGSLREAKEGLERVGR